MVGTALMEYVRKILRDVYTNTQKDYFWSDGEILLCLNAAQDIFLNNMLKLGQDSFLRGLITRTSYVLDSDPVPADYVYFLTAHVGDEEDLKLAELYTGGEAVVHYRTKQAQASVLGNTIRYRRSRLPAGGRLYYYKRPNPIIEGEFDNSFDDEIYNVQIANLASVICAVKETSTSRDYKRMKRWLTDLTLNPKRDDNYIFDWEKGDYSRDIQPNENAAG